MSPMPELPVVTVVTVVTVPLLIDTVPATAVLSWFVASNDKRDTARSNLLNIQSAMPDITCVSCPSAPVSVRVV